MLKNSLTGLLLSIQFFTSLPIKKQLPMNRQTVTAMYGMMPLISILMGTTIVLFSIFSNHFLQFSPLLTAVLIVIANIVMTGGLHLDGLTDMGDAYFSYQDSKRRLEILDDPRVGAFGVMTLVVVILLKVAFIFELLTQGEPYILYYFIAIPFLSRLAMLMYFLTMTNVKQQGLAAYFKGQVIHKNVWIFLAVYVCLFVVISFYLSLFNLFVLFISMVLIVLIYRKWTYHNFGGMTGDLLGALYEGMELWLWGVLLLFT